MNNFSAAGSEGSSAATAVEKEQSDQHELRMISSILAPRFTGLQLLSDQGEAAIFLAREKKDAFAETDHLVKLKVVCEHDLMDRKNLELFYLETRAAAKLSHKNIIKTGEPEQIDNLHFAVIEMRQDSESLRRLLDLRAWLDAQLAASIMLQVAEALDYAHSHGVLHLRLRPESILIDIEGAVLITDFGIEQGEELRWARLARSQSSLAHYCSPEQASGQDADARSDLYSLGIILYEMLTDRVPFYSQDANVIKQKHITQPPARPEIFRQDLPAQLSETVMSLLEKDPFKRPKTPACLQSGLNIIIQEQRAAEINEAARGDERSLLIEKGSLPGDGQPEMEAESLNDPILDIGIDDEETSARAAREEYFSPFFSEGPLSIEAAPLQPTADMVNWGEISHSQNALFLEPDLSEESQTEAQPGARPKRERFEPPTIIALNSMEDDLSDDAPRVESPARASVIESKRPAQIEQSAPSGIKTKLFAVLLAVISIAAMILLDPANLLNLFQSRALADLPTEAGSISEKDQSQPTEPASTDIKDQASSGTEAISPLAVKPRETRPGEIRSSSRAQGRRANTAIRYTGAKPTDRVRQRKFRSYRARRPTKWFKWRVFGN